MLQTSEGRIAAYRYATLPYREFPKNLDANLIFNADTFKCQLLGFIEIKMRSGGLFLAAWRDNISGVVFWWQGSCSEIRLLKLKRCEFSYEELNCPIYELEGRNLQQFVHYALGYAVNFESDYDRDARIKFCRSVCRVFGQSLE